MANDGEDEAVAAAARLLQEEVAFAEEEDARTRGRQQAGAAASSSIFDTAGGGLFGSAPAAATATGGGIFATSVGGSIFTGSASANATNAPTSGATAGSATTGAASGSAASSGEAGAAGSLAGAGGGASTSDVTRLIDAMVDSQNAMMELVRKTSANMSSTTAGGSAMSTLGRAIDTKGMLKIEDYHGEKPIFPDWRESLYGMLKKIDIRLYKAYEIIDKSLDVERRSDGWSAEDREVAGDLRIILSCRTYPECVV